MKTVEVKTLEKILSPGGHLSSKDLGRPAGAKGEDIADVTETIIEKCDRDYLMSLSKVNANSIRANPQEMDRVVFVKFCPLKELKSYSKKEEGFHKHHLTQQKIGYFYDPIDQFENPVVLTQEEIDHIYVDTTFEYLQKK